MAREAVNQNSESFLSNRYSREIRRAEPTVNQKGRSSRLYANPDEDAVELELSLSV